MLLRIFNQQIRLSATTHPTQIKKRHLVAHKPRLYPRRHLLLLLYWGSGLGGYLAKAEFSGNKLFFLPSIGKS